MIQTGIPFIMSGGRTQFVAVAAAHTFDISHRLARCSECGQRYIVIDYRNRRECTATLQTDRQLYVCPSSAIADLGFHRTPAASVTQECPNENQC